MKFAEAVPGALVLAARAAWLAFDPDPGSGGLPSVLRWAGDWISVLALLWIALVVTRKESRARRWAIALACAWLTLLYGVHQGPHTWAGWR